MASLEKRYDGRYRIVFCRQGERRYYSLGSRSEILRSRVDDLDFEAGTGTIREKKRDRSREMTFRSVPMAGRLRAVLGT